MPGEVSSDKMTGTPPNGATDANLPEVVQSQLPEVKGYYGQNPESVGTSPNGSVPPGKEAPDANYPIPYYTETPPATSKICGLRKRTFLIALAVTIVILIAVIVGGVVGGLKANSDDDNGDNVDDNVKPTSSPTSTSPAQPKQAGEDQSSSTLSTKSKLASAGWTYRGVIYRRVYFQGKDGMIRQSGWSSDTKKWDVREMNNVTTLVSDGDGLALDPKTNVEATDDTPLAISLLNNPETGDFKINIFYLDPDQNVRDIWTEHREAHKWDFRPTSMVSVSSDSQLAANYLPTCEDPCVYPTVIMATDQSGELSMVDRGTYTTFDTWDALSGIQSGGAMDTVPFKTPGDGFRLYINSGGFVQSFRYWVSEPESQQWENMLFSGPKISTDSRIAVLGTGDIDGNYDHIWLFHTHGASSASSSGVIRWFGHNNDDGSGDFTWDYDQVAVQEMADVLPESDISANEDGSIYAIEKNGDNGGYQLVRWEIDNSGEVTRDGVVATS